MNIPQTDHSMPLDVEWLIALRSFSFVASLDLDQLSPGNLILVQTDNTRYSMRCLDADVPIFDVAADIPGKPFGKMKLLGCALGTSSTIAPRRLFCGGSLELCQKNEDGSILTHRTSTITKLAWLHRKKSSE